MDLGYETLPKKTIELKRDIKKKIHKVIIVTEKVDEPEEKVEAEGERYSREDYSEE